MYALMHAYYCMQEKLPSPHPLQISPLNFHQAQKLYHIQRKWWLYMPMRQWVRECVHVIYFYSDCIHYQTLEDICTHTVHSALAAAGHNQCQGQSSNCSNQNSHPKINLLTDCAA